MRYAWKKSAAAALISAASIITAPAALADGGNDEVGESLYQGKWYSPKWEDERKCIMKRESNYNYKAANKTSSARGAYQFLDSQWRVSLTHMLMPEHKDQREEVLALRDKPIHKWSPYWQDAAFFTAWRHGEGKQHWYSPTIRC